MYGGMDRVLAVAQLKESGRFDRHMLDFLDIYSPAQAEFEEQEIPVGDVRAGMILEEDLWAKNGTVLILLKGTLPTATWIERLENFAKARGLKELVRVRNPRRPGVRKSELARCI